MNRSRICGALLLAGALLAGCDTTGAAPTPVPGGTTTVPTANPGATTAPGTNPGAYPTPNPATLPTTAPYVAPTP